MNYNFEKLNREELRDYRWLINGIKNQLPELNDEQVMKVLEIVMDVCSSCYDSYRGCQCWNDE